MSSHDIVYVLALVCFAIGALKNIGSASPRLVDKIDWLCAGLFFVVLGWGFFLR
jgi:hypothetical protein